MDDRTLSRRADWLVAGRAGTLGLDPVKGESGFSRLLSVGKLLAAIPQLDPLTVSASIAARVMALRSKPCRTAMDQVLEEATNATTLLDARKILPRLIAAADPSTIPPEMVRIDAERECLDVPARR